MTAPIAISSTPPPKPQQPVTHGHQPSGSTSSTVSSSSSPQTPFSPYIPIISSTAPGDTKPTQLGASPNSSILKWASSFGSLGKSPTSPGIFNNPSPFTNDHDHDHDEHHDAFEFGDTSDLARGSWTGHSRRAASMSNPSGVAASAPGGISAMLSGFGSGGAGTAGGLGAIKDNAGPAFMAGSPPSVPGGVIADNAAKGQGLLRRLSLGGAGRGRPVISPTSVPAPLPPTQATTMAGGSDGMLSPDSSAGQRGRRYSENQGAGKKRGVSPMGERILRDHGHF